MNRCRLCGNDYNEYQAAHIVDPTNFRDNGMLSGSVMVCCYSCGLKVGPIASGRFDYEKSLREYPSYPAQWGLSTEPRPSWDNLPDYAKRSWISPYELKWDYSANRPYWVVSLKSSVA